MKPLMHSPLDRPVIPKRKQGICILYVYLDMNGNGLKSAITFLIRSDLQTWFRDSQSINMVKWCYYQEMENAVLKDA